MHRLPIEKQATIEKSEFPWDRVNTITLSNIVKKQNKIPSPDNGAKNLINQSCMDDKMRKNMV